MDLPNLADVCNHQKAMVISSTPEDFVISEAFSLGLTNEELIAGINSFRSFLYMLYDFLAANADRFDVKSGQKNATIPARFPIIEELGAILFSLGFYGKLETEPRCELVVHGRDMLTVSKMEKYKHLIKMSKARKLELFTLLENMGFYFEDADFSNNIDFSQVSTFYLQCENDNLLPVGLKLLALAQANIKAGYYRYSSCFMRGDFYPLQNEKPKPITALIADYANTQPTEVKEWILDLDKLLTQSCKVSGVHQYFLCGGVFDYVSRKTKELICRINLLVYRCSIIPGGNHINNRNSILGDLTDNMFKSMQGRNNACRNCSEENNPDFVKCMHGGTPYKFTINDEDFELCRFSGFQFSLNNANEREVLRKWVELELSV